MEKCIVCGASPMVFSWTDTHGVAQCRCGTPYRILHYGEDGEPVEGVCSVNEQWIPLLIRYREDTGRIIPGCHSFPGGQELAGKEDFTAWAEWCDKHNHELPGYAREP